MRATRFALTALLGSCLIACAGPARRTDTGIEAVPPAKRIDALALFLGRAREMVGQPYRFGGAKPGGFDCSGLVVYAANAAGISLPRTTHELLHAGVPVQRAGLQPGDLVFMRLKHKELHVGIVIDGGRFIHAPSGGERVRVDSLAAPAYARRYVGARRVIPP